MVARRRGNGEGERATARRKREIKDVKREDWEEEKRVFWGHWGV